MVCTGNQLGKPIGKAHDVQRIISTQSGNFVSSIIFLKTVTKYKEAKVFDVVNRSCFQYYKLACLKWLGFIFDVMA